MRGRHRGYRALGNVPWRAGYFPAGQRFATPGPVHRAAELWRNTLHSVFGFFENRQPDMQRPTSPPYEHSDSGTARAGVKAERPVAWVDTHVCSGCGACVNVCPRGAITMRDTAVIEAGVCIGCGACVRACPSGAISLKQP